ncbi:MAG: hypothetical protein JO187_09095 [Acidobacteria bacterium]|nr:hypothetical protein [Acidobacteriaceae bacterium]MBV9609700.1 hypothetical protein [Acidobacteriota bacterium]
MADFVDTILKHMWLAPLMALALPIIAFCFVLFAMLHNQTDDERRAERKRAFQSHLPG